MFVVIITQPAEFVQARKEKKILIYSMIKGRFLYELYLDRSKIIPYSLKSTNTCHRLFQITGVLKLIYYIK